MLGHVCQHPCAGDVTITNGLDLFDAMALCQFVEFKVPS
jgi:hypothetical protein